MAFQASHNFEILFQESLWARLVAHTWNPSTWDTETEEHIFKAILVYIVRLCQRHREVEMKYR